MNNLFVIDGKNLCHWIAQFTKVERDLSIQPLLSVISALQRNDDDFICIFDANTVQDLTRTGRRLEAEVVSNLIAKYPDRFRIVARGTKADPLILAEADDRNCEIISNDLYRQYQEKYEWLRHSHPPRLIGANLSERAVIFDDRLTLLPVPLLQDMAKVSADIGSKIPLVPPRYIPIKEEVVASAEKEIEQAVDDEEILLNRDEIRALERRKKSAETQAASRNEKIHKASAIALKTGLGILSFFAVVGVVMDLMQSEDRN
jgi:hypothetical protein